ncbi:MAG: Slp family lipoprotein [Pseudomonadota bacterium]
MRRLVRPLSRLLAPLTLLALAACAPAPIYKPGPNMVSAVPFQVARTPERYANGSVIWGGRIVAVHNLADRSEIEVLAFPLDSSQRPQVGDSGSGRFIAVMNGFVEPMDYPEGALITLTGTLAGSRAGNVGEANYVFPLVKVDQAHRWTQQELQSGRSNVHFGIGVGVGIH